MATPARLLLGPPELCHFTSRYNNENSDSSPASASTTPPPTGDNFLDMLRSGMLTGGHKSSLLLPMGTTENLSPTFLSSGDACLDFFFHVVPDTPPHRLIELLEAAWRQNPLTALKLVCQLRGVRGTGKSEREGFYTAACWIFSHHPKTLAANAPIFAEFGYLKDLLEILLRLVQGPEETEKRKADRKAHKKKKISRAKSIKGYFARKGRPKSTKGYFARKGAAAREAKKLGTLMPREERIAADLLRGKQESERAQAVRRQKRLEVANRALKRYSEDSNYRALHDRIAQHFADLLSKDLEALKSAKIRNLSMAAKWCPSLDSSYDRSTLICENIARSLFPREDYSDIKEESHNVYRVRDKLRTEVLVPIRRALELPEVYMSANMWCELPYNRVASVAMKKYKDLFIKHDSDRFSKYLEDVKAGKKKIAAGALLPHEIIEQALESKDGVAELQWKRMVEDMTKEGKFSNSLAVCDVSGSMMGTPMEVCIALGMLVSEMSEEPWKGHLITFSRNPQLQLVKGDSLVEKYEFTKSMEWDMNTDFQKVFDLILAMARKSNLDKEKMIKQLIVFSDMEFDEASANPWQTDYMAIKRKFRDAGYEAPPRIVFWNLRDSQSTPVLREEDGVAMVSGFSKNLLKIFLRANGQINPMLVLKEAIQGKLYDRLVILD